MKYFVSVVECNSFTIAAEQNYISQSAISQQIAALEAELDVTLFVREKRKFSLTQAGHYFYEQSKQILQQIDEVTQKTKDIEDDENVLKIGYLKGFRGQEIQEAMIAFASLYPHVMIELTRGTHEQLYQALIHHEIHLAVSDQRRSFSDSYENYHLLHINCYIACHENNSLCQYETIDVQQLKNETCIIVAEKEQRDVEKEFYENYIGMQCKYQFVDGNEEGQVLVSMDKGFMPIELVTNKEYRIAHAVTIPLYKNGNQIQRNYCAFWPKDKGNYYIEEFADILRTKMRKAHGDM